MNRPGGIPIVFWIGGLVAGIGAFTWFRKRNASSAATSPATAGKTGQPAFSQAQEVEDFQVFSALTSAQQGSDLNFLGQAASLLGGGSSTGTSNIPTPSTGVPSPPVTGTTPPATVPASTVAAAPSGSAQSQPGYGAGVGALAAANPGILSANSPGGPNIPGITGYQVSYNGVPI